MKNLSRASLLLFLFAAAGAILANPVLAAEKIDVNTAPLEELVKIIHIGEARAKELISLRPFSSLDDLMKINGVGSLRIADIKKQGLAWVDESYQVESQTTEPQPISSKGLTAAGEPIFKTPASFTVFLIAALVAIFSAVIILALEKKVRIGLR